MSIQEPEKACELTILMPCLDEAETLATCINKANKGIANGKIDGEILIADNGSTDGSQEIAERLGARVINVEEKGYGSALRTGIIAAKGKYIIMGDSDDSYDFSAIESFVTSLRQGYDLVMGNRFKGGIEKNAMPFLHRYLGNPVLSFVGRLFFRIPVRDFHCGLRGFNRNSILKLDLRTTGMEFASEMIVKSAMQKLRITEVPAKLYPDGRSRPPHLRTWHDGWRHLRFLLMFSPRWLFLYPGLTLMALGIFITLALLNGPVYLGRIGFDVHTMLYGSSFIIIGFQVIAFFFFSKTYTVNAGLDPDKSWLQKMNRLFSLERGILLGGIILLLGISLTLYSFLTWNSYSFGHLDPSHMLRLVIPSVTFLVIGIQLIFYSFFLSILSLKKH